MIHDKKGIWLGLGLILAIEIWVLWLPQDHMQVMIREDGPIEMASAIGYLFAAAGLFIAGYYRRMDHGLFSGLLVLSLALRELDFHDRFTTMGIFKTLFYVSPKVPIPEKIIVTLLVLCIFFGFFWYVKKFGRRYLQALRNKDNGALCVTIAVALAILSKTLDSNSDEINQLIMSITSYSATIVVSVSEEVFELGIPLFIILALYYGSVRYSGAR